MERELSKKRADEKSVAVSR